MKKLIPEKIANKVYDKLLAGERLDRDTTNWLQKTLYKPGTTYLHNRFFKNSVGKYFRVAPKDDWDIGNKLVSTRKRWESTQDQLNDYI